MGLRNFDALHSLEMINGRDLGRFLASISMDADGRIAHFDFATDDFAQCDDNTTRKTQMDYLDMVDRRILITFIDALCE